MQQSSSADPAGQMTGQKEDGNGTATKKKYIIIPKQPDESLFMRAPRRIMTAADYERIKAFDTLFPQPAPSNPQDRQDGADPHAYGKPT